MHPNINIALRFGDKQGYRLRSCGDLKHPTEQLACDVGKPIKLVSRGHAAEIRRNAELSGRDWNFTKADRADAYKRPPMEWGHARVGVVALKRPVEGGVVWLFSRTILFGAADAVLRYNVFSRIVAELFARLFGVPLLGLFGDFGASVPAFPAELDPRARARICALSGYRDQRGEIRRRRMVTFLGMDRSSPCAPNDVDIHPHLTSEKLPHRRNCDRPSTMNWKAWSERWDLRVLPPGEVRKPQVPPVIQESAREVFADRLTRRDLSTFRRRPPSFRN